MDKRGYNCQEAAHYLDIERREPAHVQQHQVVDYLIPRKTVERLSGLSRATIYRLIKSGKFPRPLSIGTGSIRWRQSDVIAWQQSLSVTA
jgi:prophage regulatory protein